MLSVHKGKNPDELYSGDDGFLKCKCDVCKEEMNFCDTYCYVKKDGSTILGHRRCIVAYVRGEQK